MLMLGRHFFQLRRILLPTLCLIILILYTSTNTRRNGSFTRPR